MDRQFIRAIVGVFSLLAALFAASTVALFIVRIGRLPEGLSATPLLVDLAWTVTVGVVFAALARRCLRIRRP